MEASVHRDQLCRVLPNTTESDRHYALGLLERWGLLAPPPHDFEVTEDF